MRRVGWGDSERTDANAAEGTYDEDCVRQKPQLLDDAEADWNKMLMIEGMEKCPSQCFRRTVH